MISVAIFLSLSLAMIAKAQHQCDAIADLIPSCAVSALESAAADVGCGSEDYSCQCAASNLKAINNAALSGVLKACGAVTGIAVEASGSAVCACAATATSTSSEISITSSSGSTSSKSSTTSTPAVVASSAIPATTSASTTSTTASAKVSPSTGTASGSTTSSGAAQVTGAAAKVIALIGGCLGAFIAIMAAL